MARPAKRLAEHVRDGTFRARRDSHRALLLGPPLPWPLFASLQLRHGQARSEAEQRALALEFEQLVRQAHTELRRRSSSPAETLAAALAPLGKAGSVAHLLRFFPDCFVHPRGPMIGRPFILEGWQLEPS